VPASFGNWLNRRSLPCCGRGATRRTLANYLANAKLGDIATDRDEFRAAEDLTGKRIDALLGVQGSKTVTDFHKELGKVLWNKVGMARNKQGLTEALSEVRRLREEYHQNVRVVGKKDDLNKALEYGMRVADYLEFAEVLVRDALEREESCGCHFREEYQTEEGECLRNDEQYSYVAAWEYTGEDKDPVLHKEPLTFEFAEVKQRSYK